jgi:hypothetical protein
VEEDIGERVHTLGSGEFRITSSNGATFVAPDLIVHYIADHAYLPPQEFLEAVLEAGPTLE